MNNYLRLALSAVVSILTLGSGQALADQEQEVNNTVEAANVVSSGNGTIVIDAAIGNSDRTATPTQYDVDYFSFYAKAGDVITVDIDGYTGTSGVDTSMWLFGPKEGNYQPLAESYAASSADPNPRIDSLMIRADGLYTVEVTAWQDQTYGYINYHEAELYGTPISNGTYRLTISGLKPTTPSAKQVEIEVLAKQGILSNLNPKKRGNIHVALLSSDTFDAVEADQESLTFGATGQEAKPRSCDRGGRDVNSDDRPDLICKFTFEDTGLGPNKREAVLKGKTIKGETFHAKKAVKTMPSKSKHFHDEDDRGHRR